MEIYRVTKKAYLDQALNGKGAALFGGRWNRKEIPTVYCSASRALAMLEIIVNAGRMKALPIDLIILTVVIPDNCISSLKLEDCPTGWNKTPLIFTSQIIFTEFYHAQENLALAVPSIVIPEENNILLNPNHKLMNEVKIIGEREVKWDGRF